jgi:uncharacterized protein (TIGR02996 family)
MRSTLGEIAYAVMSELGEALRAARHELALGRHLAGLHALLDAWRVDRSESVGELIDVLTSRMSLPALEARRRKDLHSLWLDTAQAGCVADVPRLLATIAIRPFNVFPDRMARLVPRAADPRIGVGLANLVASRTLNTSIGTRGWTSIFAELERSGDARVRAALESVRVSPLPGELGQHVTKLVERVLAVIPEPGRPLPSPLVEVLGELRVLIEALPIESRPEVLLEASPQRSHVRVEESFLAAIYESPDDDAPRLVYADWLAERGDPRGEFIHLQCKAAAGPLRSIDEKRMRSLARRHRVRLLGPLEPVLDEFAKFERGFVSECFSPVFKTPRQLDELGDHPAWSTLRILHRGRLSPFVTRCRLRGLRVIYGAMGLDDLARMATRAHPYEQLQAITVMVSLIQLMDPDLDRGALARLTNLPRLRHLALDDSRRSDFRELCSVHPQYAQKTLSPRISPEDVPWLFGTEVGHRIETLSVAVECLPLPSDLAMFSKLVRILPSQGLELARAPGSQRWTLEVHLHKGQVASATRIRELVASFLPLWRDHLDGARVFGLSDASPAHSVQIGPRVSPDLFVNHLRELFGDVTVVS